jgi:YfiH family protein
MSAEYLTHPSLAVRHGFFTRRGGVSTGPYASLNCSLSSGDDPAHLAQNRARAAAALGVDATHLLGVTQVHGTEIVPVHTLWPAGQGPRADAMVTAVPGLALGVITADCAPVLFCDAQARVVGAAHAGWRGAASGVLEATVSAMEALGAATSRLAAVVGPCIAQASYEVGDDLRDQVLPTLQAADTFFASGRRAGHWQFDLAGYCVARLHHAGVTRVASLGADTCADEARFYSHRRRTLAGGGPIGHQLSAIVIGEGEFA